MPLTPFDDLAPFFPVLFLHSSFLRPFAYRRVKGAYTTLDCTRRVKRRFFLLF